MKLLILSSIAASLDGMTTINFKPNEIVTIDESKPRELECTGVLVDLKVKGEPVAKLVSDEEAEEHLADLARAAEEKKAAERDANQKAHAEKQASKRKLTNPAKPATGKPPPPTPPVNTKPTKPTHDLKLGDLVTIKGDSASQVMTVEKLVGADEIECVWFEEIEPGKFGGKPQRMTTKAAELVKFEKAK